MSATRYHSEREFAFELLTMHARSPLTQQRIDAIRDERARDAGMMPLSTLVATPTGRICWGDDERPLRAPFNWARVRAWLIIAGSILASASVGFLFGVALGVIWEAVVSR